jgi:hypothetical protein
MSFLIEPTFPLPAGSAGPENRQALLPASAVDYIGCLTACQPSLAAFDRTETLIHWMDSRP